MTTRDVDDISTAPGGKSGAEWTTDVRNSIIALWALNGGMLTNIAGTNVITGNIAISDGFTTYTDGLRIGFIAANSNTGATTLNVSSIGEKAIRTSDGDVLDAGAIIADRYTEVVFHADTDQFRLVSSSGTTNVTIQGGIMLQRSSPTRLAAAVGATTSVTTIASISFQAISSDSRIIAEGNAGLVTQSGSEDVDGIVVALYVDGTSEDSFTAHCLQNQVINVPYYFSYSPADTAAHTYSIRVSSTISSIYPKDVNSLWLSEITPNN